MRDNDLICNIPVFHFNKIEEFTSINTVVKFCYYPAVYAQLPKSQMFIKLI